MARPRTGQLIYRKTKGWCARVSLTIEGEKVRKVLELGTHDKLVARRKLKRLVADQDHDSAEDVEQVAQAAITVAEAVEAAHARWVRDGIVEADQRLSKLTRYALPHVGDIPVNKVRGADVTEVLAEAKASGLRRQTVIHIRNALHYVFDDLWRDEVIGDNPVKKARTPKFREVKKAFAVMTDEEIATLIADPDRDLEIKMLVIVSRTIGGMRAGDLNALEWSSFSREFAFCTVPRLKTDKPQVLAVPEPVRPYIAAWWRALGAPADGPVFPVRRGPRAGEAKKKTNMSYAKRFRRELGRALGTDAVATWTGHRWKEKEGHHFSERERELFTETATTRPVNFHSTRRAFNTALSRANVNMQTAMILAGHSDPKVHQRYVAAGVQVLPEAATPKLPPVQAFPVPKRGSQHRLPVGSNGATSRRKAGLAQLVEHQLPNSGEAPSYHATPRNHDNGNGWSPGLQRLSSPFLFTVPGDRAQSAPHLLADLAALAAGLEDGGALLTGAAS